MKTGNDISRAVSADKLAGIIQLMLLSIAVMAAPGDDLAVLGLLVNVRAGPSPEHAVVMRLEQGRRLREIGRRDGWVEVDLQQAEIQSGWIHSSLLVQVDADAVVEQLDSEPVSNHPYDRFMPLFTELNGKIEHNTGGACFTSVVYVDHGVIEITATGLWFDKPREERESDLEEIFNLWDEAVGGKYSLSLSILNENGIALMSILR